MGKRVAGICYIKVDGQQLEVSGGVEAPLSAVKREIKMGPNGPGGFSEVAQEPYVKVTAFFTASFPLSKLVKSTDMTVTAEWPNGKVYTLSGAYLSGELPAKSEDGTTELTFNGDRGEWK